MGNVTFIDRATGQPVLAEFPLHPGLVGYTRPDGTQGQLYREDFDKAFRQQLPELPTVNPAFVPPAAAGETAVPLKTDMAAPGAGAFILGHEAWFTKIWEEIQIIRAKVDRIETWISDEFGAPSASASPAPVPVIDLPSDTTG